MRRMRRTKRAFDPHNVQVLKDSGLYGGVYYGIKLQDLTTKKCFNILEKRGLTKEQIGVLLGVSQSMVSKYKNGVSEIPACKWITLVCYTDPDMFDCFDDIATRLFLEYSAEEEKDDKSK